METAYSKSKWRSSFLHEIIRFTEGPQTSICPQKEKKKSIQYVNMVK